MANELQGKKIAIIAEDYSFPYTQVFGFALGYCKAGGQIVQRQWVPLGTKDFGSVIANLSDDVDAVFRLADRVSVLVSGPTVSPETGMPVTVNESTLNEPPPKPPPPWPVLLWPVPLGGPTGASGAFGAGHGLPRSAQVLGRLVVADLDRRMTHHDLDIEPGAAVAHHDLVPGPALAHKSSDEGIIAVEDAAGMKTHGLEYADIPRATFCAPNVASFGLTEEQAREAGMDIVVGKLQYGAVGAGTVYGDRAGIIKIIGDKKYGELVGGHIVGAKATELIQELVNAKALEGGYAEVARIVHGHPTLSEGVMEAARAADGWLIHG